MLFGAARPGTSLVTPIVQNIYPLLANTTSDWTTLSFPLTVSSGNLLVMFSMRTTTATPGGLNPVTWDGENLTEVLDDGFDANGGGCGWAGWIRDGSLSGNLVMTAGDSDYRDLIGWVMAFDRLAAAPLAANAVINPVRSEQSAHGVTINAQNANSRLIGLVAAMHEDLSPFSVSSGWTLNRQDKTGNGGIADIAAVLASKVANATGNQTLTATTAASGPPSTDDWIGLAVEVLPA
jgi:hypothetical protein